METEKDLSLSRGSALDNQYLYYVEQLLSQQHLCSIATHHHEIQQEAKALINKYKPGKETYEFESLYGIKTEQLIKLKKKDILHQIIFCIRKGVGISMF